MAHETPGTSMQSENQGTLEERKVLRCWGKDSSYRGALNMGMVTPCGRDVPPRDRTLGSSPLRVKFHSGDSLIQRQCRTLATCSHGDIKRLPSSMYHQGELKGCGKQSPYPLGWTSLLWQDSRPYFLKLWGQGLSWDCAHCVHEQRVQAQ